MHSPVPSVMSASSRPRRGVISVSTLLLGLVALTCAVLVGTRAMQVAAQSLAAVQVRDLRGRVVPLLPAGEPQVVMISSRTCSWCKRALKDFGGMAKGRPLTRLTLLTLEGAGDGTAMLEHEGLRGARLVGPLRTREETLETLGYAGTPVFIAVDRNGKVLHTIPAYPIGPELERMFAVIVGEADAP